MTSTLFAAVLASAIAAPAPDEEIKLPTGAQPLQVLARMNKDGRIEIADQITEIREEKRTRTAVIDGKEVPVEYTVRVMRFVPRTRILPAKGVKVYTAAGKEIDPTDVAVKLRKPAVVLMAWDGQKVDPFFLRIAKADTLVIVPPVEPPHIDDGAKPLPPPKPTPSGDKPPKE